MRRQGVLPENPIRRYESGSMVKYIARTCPNFGDYSGLDANQPPHGNGDYPINASCEARGYQLKGRRLIVGRKRAAHVYYGRMPKVFS